MTPRSFFSLARIDSYSAMRVAHLGQFLQDFVDGQARQPVQLQFEDGVGLHGVEGAGEL